jgi:hypothetical protein
MSCPPPPVCDPNVMSCPPPPPPQPQCEPGEGLEGFFRFASCDIRANTMEFISDFFDVF